MSDRRWGGGTWGNAQFGADVPAQALSLLRAFAEPLLVPPGGTTGQVLTKTSNEDFADEWVSLPEPPQPLPIVDADVSETAAISASKLSFLQSGTCARPRTVQDKASDILSVLDFSGVDPTGTTDSTAGIIAADLAAAARGTALSLRGNFRVSSTLTPCNDAHWIGDKSAETSFYMTSTTATLFDVSNGAVELEHFRCLPVTTRDPAARTFDISGGNFYIHDIATAANGNSFKFSTKSGTNGPVGILDRVSTSGTVQNGVDVDVDGAFIVSILNSVFSGNPAARAYAHIILRDVQGQIQILNTNMFQASQGIIAMPGSGQVVTLVKCDTTYVDSCLTASVNIAPTGTGIVQRFSFVNGWMNVSDTGSLCTISATGSSTANQIQIHNTEMIGGALGVSTFGGKRLSVKDNRFVGQSSQAILLSGVDGAHVTGNSMEGVTGTGIALSGGTDYADIHNNDLRGAATKLTNGATGSHNSIKDNMGV